jgi:hypothetical protein
MEKSRAKAIVEAIHAIDVPLNKLHEISERLPTEADKKEFRRYLGTAIGMLYTDIMMPIIKEYPDLDPDI